MNQKQNDILIQFKCVKCAYRQIVKNLHISHTDKGVAFFI